MEENDKSSPTRLDFPNTNAKVAQTEFEVDVAEGIGLFENRVLAGSPSVETEDMRIGKEGLAEIIEESEERLSEKLND